MIDSRLNRDGEAIRRRRECDECGRRFTTRERVDRALPKLVKRNGGRQDYAHDKLLHSIEMACAKRPVSEEAILRLVDRVERRLSEAPDAEVPTSSVGELALDELCAVDRMAAARFASVFRGFQSPEDYDAFFAVLEDAEGPGRGGAD